MDKIDAIKRLTEGNLTKAAKVLNVSRSTLYSWPVKLTPQQELMVLGALVKLGKRKI
jgi:hypothetical protein